MNIDLQILLKAKEDCILGKTIDVNVVRLLELSLSDGPLSHRILSAGILALNADENLSQRGIKILEGISNDESVYGMPCFLFLGEAWVNIIKNKPYTLIGRSVLMFAMKGLSCTFPAGRCNLITIIGYFARQENNAATIILLKAIDDSDYQVQKNALVELDRLK